MVQISLDCHASEPLWCAIFGPTSNSEVSLFPIPTGHKTGLVGLTNQPHTSFRRVGKKQINKNSSYNTKR